jgi:hypothetical protein
MSHTIADAPMVAAEAPLPAHGDAADKPSPTPRIVRMSASDAATNAPAITAPHETPDAGDSRGGDISVKNSGSKVSLVLATWFIAPPVHQPVDA